MLVSQFLKDPGITRQFPQQFSIREMLLRGTAIFAKEWRTLLLLQVVVFTILYIADVLVSGTFPGTLAHFIAFALKSVLQLIISLGLLFLYIRAVDGKSIEVLDIFEPIELFWSYAGVMILYAIIVVLGTIALVVPGVIAACGLCLAQYLTIDRKLMPTEALRVSWKRTEGHKMTIALFFATLLVVNIIAATTVVGILVTAPVSGLAYAGMYRYFFPQVGGEIS